MPVRHWLTDRGGWTMKFAAIADVHGNCLALEAVLADIFALGVTEVVNLGDHVSGPLEPRRTADLLMRRGCIHSRRSGSAAGQLGPTGASSHFDHKQLDRKHLDWLASLPPTLLYRDDVLLCHGSPQSDAAWWLDRVAEDGTIEPAPIYDIEAEASGVKASLILCGHTHLPRVARPGRPSRRQRRQRRLPGIRRRKTGLS